MKILTAITIGLLGATTLFANVNRPHYTTNETQKLETQVSNVSEFDKAVALIKKYEGLHSSKHWPLIGYGHKVMPGEKYSRSRVLSEKEADALLRQDLKKLCTHFRSFGADSLIMAVLAYNIGPGAASRSSVAKKLKEGNRDIYASYVAHSRYRGKVHSQIKRRRIEEYETLFIKETVKEDGHIQVEEKAAVEERQELAMATSAFYFETPFAKNSDEEISEIEIPDNNRKEEHPLLPTHYNTPIACNTKNQKYYWA